MNATMPGAAAAPFSLCVYCGSRAGLDPRFRAAAQALGTALGRRGWRLVYGGGRVGLMGVVADAALAAGGTVFGVIPVSLQEREVGHTGLSELRIVSSMHQRKQAMAEAADAFLALPGGIGTLEELFEVWTWRQLGDHDRPLGLLNVADFYDGLLDFLDQTVAQGFVGPATRALLTVDAEIERLLDRLHQQAGDRPGRPPLELDRI